MRTLVPPSHRASRLAALVIVIAVAIGGALTGCADKASEDECERLLTHVIELEIASSTAGTKPTDEEKASMEKQKKAVSDYLRKQFVDKCQKDVPGAFIRCGLKAKVKEDLARCDKD